MTDHDRSIVAALEPALSFATTFTRSVTVAWCGANPAMRTYLTGGPGIDAACGAAADRTSFTGWECHVGLGR